MGLLNNEIKCIINDIVNAKRCCQLTYPFQNDAHRRLDDFVHYLAVPAHQYKCTLDTQGTGVCFHPLKLFMSIPTHSPEPTTGCSVNIGG